MGHLVCLRLISTLTMIAGLGVLGVSGWALFSLLTDPSFGQFSVEPQVSNEKRSNVYQIPIGENGEVGNITTAAGMRKRYKILIEASIGVSLIGSAGQLILGLILFVSGRNKIQRRASLWALGNFVVILLVGMCILVPLSYNQKRGTFRGAASFGRYIKTEVLNFVSGVGYNGPHSYANFLFSGLNLYYSAMFLNLACLFLFIICSCFLNFCSNTNQHRNVYTT